MGYPIDTETRTPVTQRAHQTQPIRKDTRVSQHDGSSRDSYSSDPTQAEYQAQRLQDQRVKQFVLKNRALGQDVGMKRDVNGTMRAHWNSGSKEPSYFASKQHRQDSAEFLLGETEGALELVSGTLKGAVENSPLNQGLRFAKDPAGEFDKKVQNAKGLVNACSNPRESLTKIGNGLHDQYVKPFKDGDMRASGNVSGKAIVTTALTRYSPSGVKPGRGGVKSSAKNSGNSNGGRISGSSASTHTSSSSSSAMTGSGSASASSGSGSAVRSQKTNRTGKPKPSTATISSSLAADIAKFPRKISKGFGHGVSKHGPKDQAAYQEVVAKLKPNGKETSWFRTQQDLDQVVKTAPDYLPSILKANPKKAVQLKEFLDNPNLKGKFGFIVPLAKNSGRGVLKSADGALLKIRSHNSAYIEYAWQQAKGGQWEMMVKTTYPLRKEGY